MHTLQQSETNPAKQVSAYKQIKTLKQTYKQEKRNKMAQTYFFQT